MSNDGKLGLVIGIGLVVLIAIVYFRRDPPGANATSAAGTPAPIQSARTGISPPTVGSNLSSLGVTPLTPASGEVLTPPTNPTSPRVQVPAEPESITPVPPSPRSR